MNPATFRTLREFLGIEQEWLAAVLGVDRRTVQRWEKTYTPPQDAVDLLESIHENWISLADKTLDRIDAEPTPPEQVDLTRYLTEDSYRREHPDSTETLSMHNAKIRYFYSRLSDAGYTVAVHFAPIEP